MANTFYKIASVTVGSGGSATISFTSIPSTYNNLCLKFSVRSSKTGTDNDQANLTFNSSSSGYSDMLLYGRGSTADKASSDTTYIQWAGIIPAASATANTFSNSEIIVPNYAGSAAKSLSSDNAQENNSSTDYFLTLLSGFWNNTAAITTLTLTCNGGNFVQNSTAILYGINNS
jgi:hypothetical protein